MHCKNRVFRLQKNGGYSAATNFEGAKHRHTNHSLFPNGVSTTVRWVNAHTAVAAAKHLVLMQGSTPKHCRCHNGVRLRARQHCVSTSLTLLLVFRHTAFHSSLPPVKLSFHCTRFLGTPALACYQYLQALVLTYPRLNLGVSQRYWCLFVTLALCSELLGLGMNHQSVLLMLQYTTIMLTCATWLALFY